MSNNIATALNRGRVLLAPFIILGAGAWAFSMVVSAQDNTTTSVVVTNAAATLSVNFHDNAPIILNESTFSYATASLTITDANGCSTINHVEARARLASTSMASSSSCTANDLSCYTTASTTLTTPTLPGGCIATTSGNSCTGGVDTSVVYDCGFKLWYIAEATDSGAPEWASSIWGVVATTSDGVSTTTASNSTQVVEINSLSALNLTSTLSYGTLSAGSDTNQTNSTTTATTTGNVAIDAQISGTSMTALASTTFIHVSQQEFKTSPFDYGAGTDLTGAPASTAFTSAQPSATTSDPTQAVSWGINIPSGQTNATYSGTNTFTATQR